MKTLLLLFFSVFTVYAGDTQNLQFDINSHELKFFTNLEQTLKSKKFITQTENISSPGIAAPVIYRRKEIHLPDLLCYYFYYIRDSSIAYVLYEWDEKNFSKQEPSIKSDKEIKSFISKYKNIYSDIVSKFGQSTTEGDKLILSAVKKGTTRIDNWKLKNGTKIQLYITLSSDKEKSLHFETKPTYRIRLYIYNKQYKSIMDLFAVVGVPTDHFKNLYFF